VTRNEALKIAIGVCGGLPDSMYRRLKAIHIAPKLHQGMLTIRVFSVNETAPDQEPFIFTTDEL